MTSTTHITLARGLARAVLATGLATGLTAGLTAGLAAPVGAAPDRSSTVTGSARAGTAAGTIVYIANYNVWIARGDGSGARALTTDGTFAAPYGAPTQSDGGVVVATHSERLVRMNQSGKVLNVIDPPPLPTSVGVSIDGSPVDAAISPDGTRIAYTFTKYLTPSGASSGFRSATGYTAADRLTDPKPLRSTYFWSPSWVGSSRTLQTGGSGSHVQIHDLGTDAVNWFNDDDIYEEWTDLGNTQLSRDGRYLTAVRGYGADSAIYWYAVNGNATTGPAPADPTPLCQIGPLEGITNPTWGPDSDSLAWQEPDGIWTRANARDCSVPSTLILPGGSEPHWSPAALSAPAQAEALKNTARPAIKGKPVVGSKLKASTGRWSLTDLDYTFQWFRNGKKLGGKAGKKRVHTVVGADRGKRLTVRVTARREGVGSGSAMSAPVRIKR